MSKNVTCFVDIDGTLLEHKGSPCEQWHDWPEAVPGAKELLDKLEQSGALIILTTARPEWNRQHLVTVLSAKGFVWHGLCMGVTSGKRVIVNDAKPDGSLAAEAIVVPRNGPIDVDSMLKTILG